MDSVRHLPPALLLPYLPRQPAASGITMLRPIRKHEAARHGEPLLKTIHQRR